MDLRNPEPDARSFPRIPADSKLASEQQGALLHSQDSQRPTGRKLLWVDSAAVIANLEDNVAILPAQPDLHSSCLGVTRHVGQSLLEDTKNRRGPLRIDHDVAVRQIQPASGPGASLELLRSPFDGSHKAQIVQDTRPQLRRDSAHR